MRAREFVRCFSPSGVLLGSDKSGLVESFPSARTSEDVFGISGIRTVAVFFLSLNSHESIFLFFSSSKLCLLQPQNGSNSTMTRESKWAWGHGQETFCRRHLVAINLTNEIFCNFRHLAQQSGLNIKMQRIYNLQLPSTNFFPTCAKTPFPQVSWVLLLVCNTFSASLLKLSDL